VSARLLYVSVCVYVCMSERKKQEKGENSHYGGLMCLFYTCIPAFSHLLLLFFFHFLHYLLLTSLPIHIQTHKHTPPPPPPPLFPPLLSSFLSTYWLILIFPPSPRSSALLKLTSALHFPGHNQPPLPNLDLPDH
jgi:hypothetical protein